MSVFLGGGTQRSLLVRPHARDREIVTAQVAATGSAVSGTDKCPDIALCKPKTPMEVPPPEPWLDNFDEDELPLVYAFLDRMRNVSAENDFLDRCITSDLDNDAAQSPPPLNLPRMWTLGAPSEDLGTPRPTGTGV